MTQPVGGRDAAFQTIVWPTDGSALAETAVPTLEALARRHASKIIVFHVSRASSGEDERLESVRRRVGALELHGFAVELVVRDRGHDDPAHEIAALADETGADVIVLATHGRGTVSSTLFGSVARDLLHLAPCPVLAVPQPAGAAAAAKLAAPIQSDHYKPSQDVSSL